MKVAFQKKYIVTLTGWVVNVISYYGCLGQKVVTDITGNDGRWTFMCASWTSVRGNWKIYRNGVVADEGINLAKGKVVKGNLVFSHINT